MKFQVYYKEQIYFTIMVFVSLFSYAAIISLLANMVALHLITAYYLKLIIDLSEDFFINKVEVNQI